MTVDNYSSPDSSTHEIDSFVHKNAKYYPETIPITHWQLRHFISNPEPEILYYASARDIYSLDTRTHVRTHVTVLPFWARCTAAGFGYICAGGGDSGHFAIVALSHTTGLSREALGYQTPRPPIVQVEQAGQEIVNSISIHKIEGDDELGTLDDVVAVLTNNDKTIRIFSLTQHTQTAVLELPFAVNHATLSPDGRALVAVGDFQQAYFYERTDVMPSAESKMHKYASSQSLWEESHVVGLHVPRTVHATGYFTTAWSPSGRLCAVASECGYVSVIDMQALEHFDNAEDAIAVVMPSTRPENAHPGGAIPGAVRTMLFAPNPWDLLIWAEDQGRVCLADLRTGLRVRQIITLKPDQDGCEVIEFKDNAGEPFSRRGQADPAFEREYIRNFRTYRTMGEDPVVPAFDFEDELAMSDARALTDNGRAARADLLLADGTSLSARERELLDELEVTSRQAARSRELLNGYNSRFAADAQLQSTSGPASRDPQTIPTRQATSIPRSIHYSELSGENRRSTEQQTSLFAQDFPALARQHGLPSASASTLLPTHRIMRDIMRERAAAGDSSSTPQRRSLLSSRVPDLDDVLASSSNSASHRQAPTLSDRATLLANSMIANDTTSSSNSAGQRQVPSLSDRAAFLASATETTTAEQAAANRRQRAEIRQRQRAAHSLGADQSLLQRYQTTSMTRGATMRAGLTDYYEPELGFRTAGLAMSADGRRLWCACDKGIFEFEINVRGRMGMPGLDVK